MSKIAIILCAVFVASSAVCNVRLEACKNKLISSIEEHKQRIGRMTRFANQDIDEKLNASMVEDETYRTIVTERSIFGPPKLEFDENGDGYVIKFTRTIDDRDCRKYLEENFDLERIRVCKHFVMYKMSAGQNEIRRETNNALRYLDRVLTSIRSIDSEKYLDESLERSCSNRIADADYVARVTEARIELIVNRTLEKMENYVDDLSDCLMSREEESPEKYDEWHSACSFYTEA